MDSEKLGNFIKDLRIKHHLTQKEFADKYHVTYQAVSKWENGKNMPDITLIKQMSKDFGFSLEEFYDGKLKNKSRKKIEIILISCLLIIIFLSIFIFLATKSKKEDFQFKTLSASCENFNISGTIAYNQTKTAIYITNIQYCGKEEEEEYQNIECVLYETNQNTDRLIDSYKYVGQEPIKLKDFLNQITLSIDNYDTTCLDYQDDTLYLSINAQKEKEKIITYKIPLKLETCTSKKS